MLRLMERHEIMGKSFLKLWRERKRYILLPSSLVIGAVIFAALRPASSVLKTPSAIVRRGEFVDYARLRGQVQAGKSVTITAPFQAGDLQILKIVSNGGVVKNGAIIVQFDASALQQTLAQDQAALKSAEAEIQQSRAKSRLTEEKDLTDVMKARYDAESAKLDASKHEILSKIDGEEAQLKLADAQQKLKEAEAQMEADKASDAADLQSKIEKRDQALYQVQQTQSSLAKLTLRAPIAGMVTLLDNYQFFTGAPGPFKPGDHAWPGAGIAEIPDLSTMKVTARVDETERGLLQVGQATSIRIDALPDRELKGQVSRISELASMDFAAGWPFPRNFTVDIALKDQDPRLRPGMTANVRIAVDKVANGIIIPSQALFHKNGQDVAYVMQGSKFKASQIGVARNSGGQVLIASGLQPGERVALQDPTVSQ